jgi:phosphomannomutase / phosphoglucomutase
VTIFRAYDVRGVYGTDLTEENVRRVGQAMGSYIARVAARDKSGGAAGKMDQGTITLGRDTRISGPSLESAFLDGVLSTGCNVDRYGVIPIAIISYVTWAERLSAAAYISASHNPQEYNGVRFRTGDGYGMLYKDAGIVDFYNSGEFISGSGSVHEKSSDQAVLKYADYMSSKLHLKRRLKVILDAGNGSAAIINPVYQKLGFDSVLINGEMDGSFPGRGPAPNEETLKGAQKAVQGEGADYGVGFDPDADRGIIIDEMGRIVPPEKVAIIIAKKRYRPGDLVISGFDCSMVLESELFPAGIKVVREKVGDVFVANKVKNSGAVLGVERSGHFFLPEFQYSDDPFAMSLALGEIISEGGKLSELADAIPDYPYVSKSIRLEKDPSEVMKVLEERLASRNPGKLDGLEIVTPDSRVLIRPSNTEPLIRLYIESVGRDVRALAEEYEKIIRDAVAY